MILRRWSGRIRSADEAEYVDYIRRTGADEYAATEGNLGYQIVVRRGADGTSEVATLSWWRDVEAIKRFAGEAYELAHYYPEDDRYLVERPETVDHYDVVEDGRQA